MIGEKHVPYELLKKRAREMRNNPTPEERKIWNQMLRYCVPKFHRQRPIDPYIVDFISPDLRLIIEIDGCQHIAPENIEYEYERTKFLKNKGYEILRFDNYEINRDFENVRYEITVFCEKRAAELNLEYDFVEKTPKLKHEYEKPRSVFDVKDE